MKRSIALIAGLGLALGTATSAGATDDETMAPGASGTEASAQALQGEVTEKQGNTLTIRRMDGEQAQVRTTDSTKIRGDQGELEIDDIETGDRVRVTALDGSHAGGQTGPRVAREIQVVERGAGESGIRDPRQMTPQQNPIQGIPGDSVSP